ncbi:MAG: DUF1289 domain-containing protein [Gammaproteobacteria bacterium]
MAASGRLRSPCIGICSTTVGDLVCRGCKRYAHEINDWHAYDADARLAVIDRLESYWVAAAKDVIAIEHLGRLKEVLGEKGIHYNANLHPLMWVYELWRKHLESPLDPIGCGLKIKSELSAPELWQQLDRAVLLRSRAHYERHFSRLDRQQIASRKRHRSHLAE